MAIPSAPPPSSDVTMGPAVMTHLEKVIFDAFKRESDQEENTWRTLPFFATSLGFIAGSATLLHSALPPFSREWFPLLVYGALVGLYLSLAVVIYYMRQQTFSTVFYLPTEETKLLEHAAALESWYRDLGCTEQQINEAVSLDLRDLALRQFAEAAETSRRNNLRRMGARAKGVLTLCVALAFIFVATIAIFVNDGLKEPTGGRNTAGHDQDSRNHRADGPADRARGAQARGPGDGGNGLGRPQSPNGGPPGEGTPGSAPHP